MLPRESPPRRAQAGAPARRGYAYRALGLATAAALLTSCSPAGFHPAAMQDDGIHAAPAPADPPPLSALATEVKDARDSRREAVAAGAEALARAHRQHQEQLDVDQEQLAREHAEAQAEAERKRLEQEGLDEEAGREVEQQLVEEAERAPSTKLSPSERAEWEETAPDDPGDAEKPDDFRTFTGDLDGYLDDLADSHSGDISISVTELGGQGRSGSSAGGESRFSASTYKLFVAYGILDRVESGELAWDDSVHGGRDRATCVDEMISISDNPCAAVFQEEIDWRGLRDIAAETGGPATDFIPAFTRTSANDLTAFMSRLESGALGLSQESRSRLLGALQGNIFRDGIPAGSDGTVLNKVGFIQGYLNDTAIVRHPQGTYVLTIMSRGSDWGSISSITTEVEAALY